MSPTATTYRCTLHKDYQRVKPKYWSNNAGEQQATTKTLQTRGAAHTEHTAQTHTDTQSLRRKKMKHRKKHREQHTAQRSAPLVRCTSCLIIWIVNVLADVCSRVLCECSVLCECLSVLYVVCLCCVCVLCVSRGLQDDRPSVCIPNTDWKFCDQSSVAILCSALLCCVVFSLCGFNLICVFFLCLFGAMSVVHEFKELEIGGLSMTRSAPPAASIEWSMCLFMFVCVCCEFAVSCLCVPELCALCLLYV